MRRKLTTAPLSSHELRVSCQGTTMDQSPSRMEHKMEITEEKYR